jgi:hypothetical protein
VGRIDGGVLDGRGSLARCRAARYGAPARGVAEPRFRRRKSSGRREARSRRRLALRFFTVDWGGVHARGEARVRAVTVRSPGVGVRPEKILHFILYFILFRSKFNLIKEELQLWMCLDFSLKIFEKKKSYMHEALNEVYL